jgi:hypothetical protein
MAKAQDRAPQAPAQNEEVLATWQLSLDAPTRSAFKTQDELVRLLAPLLASPDFQELVRDYYLTKAAKFDVRLHAWCGAADGTTLMGLVLEGAEGCKVVEMEMAGEVAVCHPAFGRPEQEPFFRAYLRQVAEMGVELLCADPVAVKRAAIASKYAPDPDKVLAPVLTDLSPRYRSFDTRSRQLFWAFFKTRETDTPWSYFFYNLVLGLDWSPEQMAEAEALALLAIPSR